MKYDDLTLGQKAAFKIVETHFTTLGNAQLLMGIYGGPGTGKSIVVDSLLCLLGQTVRSMAFVGQAAFHVDGTTIHSLLKVPFHPNSPYDLSDARVEELHDALKDVRYFIIDEISMVSKRLFIWVHKRLCQAFSNEEPFGGRNVILVGDFSQLSPVGGHSIWRTLGKHAEGLALYHLFEDVILTH